MMLPCLADRLVSPNLHVALVHVPLGLLLVGLLVEILAIFYRRSTVRPAGRWMIALGALAMIPVSASGVYALADVARRSSPSDHRPDVAWFDLLKQSPVYDRAPDGREGPRWTLLSGHIWRTGPATAFAVFPVLVWLAVSDRWRRRLYWPVGAVLVFAAAVMVWGAWTGGEAVYDQGLAVRLAERPPPLAAAYPTTAPGAARDMTEWRPTRSAASVVAPLQAHVVVAGIAVAMALAAAALAFRNSAKQERATAEQEQQMMSGFAEPGRRPAVPGDLALVRSFKPDAAVYVETLPAPAVKLWLAAAVMAIAAALLGGWFLADQTDAVARARQSHRSFFQTLWESVTLPAPEPSHGQVNPSTSDTAQTRPSSEPSGLNRRLAHVAAGAALVALPLLLAAIARWAPKRRILLGVFALLLVAVIAAQVWLGILLMLDTPGGSVARFN